MTLSKAARAANQRSLERQARGCIHFNGLPLLGPDDKRCAAGVCYRDLLGPEPGSGFRMPCSPDLKREGFEKVPCELFEERGMERAIADREESDRHWADVSKARAAITALHKLDPPTRDCGGHIDCPVCEGKRTLAWSWAKMNGHVWGKCSTAGCVSWME